MNWFKFREKHMPRVWAITEERPWNMMLVFEGWVISYANWWEDHSIGEPPTPPSLRLGTVLPPGCVISLQFGDQGLVEFDLLSWTHLILISLCYALALCHSFKSCALPPSLLFHALFLSPVWAHSVASTIFWSDNQKIAGLWERNAV